MTANSTAASEATATTLHKHGMVNRQADRMLVVAKVIPTSFSMTTYTSANLQSAAHWSGYSFVLMI